MCLRGVRRANLTDSVLEACAALPNTNPSWVEQNVDVSGPIGGVVDVFQDHGWVACPPPSLAFAEHHSRPFPRSHS